MNSALVRSPSISLSSFAFVLIACCIHPTGQRLSAELPPEKRETRERQLRHPSRLVDLETSGKRARRALLGMLILRDDTPAMAPLFSSCGGVGAQDFLFDPELRSPALRIAREQAQLARACDGTVRISRGYRADRAVHQARAVLFAADGLLEPEGYPATTRATLSALKRRLHAGLTRPASSRDAELHHLVAMLAFRLGDSGESLRHAARAVLAAPSSSRYLSNLAFFLHNARRRAQARLVYEHAHRLGPDNTAIHLGLLALAADSADPDLRQMEALALDWSRWERIPELARMAETLAAVLSSLAGLRLPVDSEHGAATEEVRLVTDLLRELLNTERLRGGTRW